MKLSETLKIESVKEHLLTAPIFFKNLFLNEDSVSLDVELQRYLFLKTKCTIEEEGNLIHYRENGMSTIEWKGIAKIQFAPLMYGAGYLIQRSLIKNNLQPSNALIVEQFNDNGKSIGAAVTPLPQILYVNMTEMEPECSITSHLYNILSYEYAEAALGQANSARIMLLERVLKKGASESKNLFSWFNKEDPCLNEIQSKLLQNEIDPALTFSEKAIVKAKLKEERNQIIKTKTRVHGKVKSLAKYTIKSDTQIKLTGFIKRPKEKSAGTLYKYTIGLLHWFFSVVKENIGYSVALAIYAPFTYYFITQPMNPGAMWAVGEVRKGYLAVFSVVSKITDTANSLSSKDNEVSQNTQSLPEASKNFTFDQSTPFQDSKAHYEGMLISTDISKVDNQSWKNRMSNFKQLQINYESNLQFSQRMGRLEQMELQLNFAVISETSYREIEHYTESLNHLKSALTLKKSYTPEAKKYIESESNRIKQFKLYVWDKMVRYMLDHPYVVLNEGKDQSFVDYYLGRNFIFFEELTKDLSKEYKGFKKPKGYDAIEKLAAFYQSKKVEGKTIEERLTKNSILHKLSHPYNTVELRNQLKRQWEILYLSYSRAQEPANFGLQLYVWSVRNAIWSMGALFTAKSREIEALVQLLNHNETVKNPAAISAFKSAQSRIEPMMESLFHILSLEYVSIREELNKKLENDLDSTQRQLLIEGIEKSFTERTSFLSSISPLITLDTP